MAAVHFENLLFLLFIGIALLFQILTRAATKANKRPGDTQRRSTSAPPPIPTSTSTLPPIRQQRAKTDEDRVREFLEALGQPTTSTPPAPLRPRTDIPPRPVAPVQPPRGAWPEISRKIPAAEPRRVEPAKVVVESPQSFPVGEVTVVSAAAPQTPEKPVTLSPIASGYETHTFASALDQSLGKLLASPEGLRNAIILREVFGPPRSLQPLELL
jgi:hypothetical protein